MTRKTRSLEYPEDPVARLRELHELDNPLAEPDEEEASDSARTQVDDNLITHVRDNARTNTLTNAHIAESPEDIVDRAYREMLSRPYAYDPRKGPFQATTVRMPTEIWERLGWACSITGKHKQDILADALKDYFMKLIQDESVLKTG